MSVKKPATTGDRVRAGKALRDRCLRDSHASVVLGRGARRDIVALIRASNEGRLKNLVPVRHARMLQSPLAFLRGTAALQAHDLAATPVSGIVVQACGDCHLMNFGGFATPERSLLFDISDFDETLPAPFEWDVKRLAASFVVAARWRGFKPGTAREAAVSAVAAYREWMREHAGMSVLEAWYSRISVDDAAAIMGRKSATVSRIRKKIREERRESGERVLHEMTRPARGLPRIVDRPPLLYHLGNQEVNDRNIASFFRLYRKSLSEERRVLFDRYRAVDVALKVVGVGSVGTRCYVALVLAAPDDALFLQLKEARPSVLQPHTRQRVAHDGQRVVTGQRLMQSASDIFLGWARGPRGRDYYVRQLRDMKVAADVESMTSPAMRSYAVLCGRALARAHAKAGDAAMIAGYLGGSDSFDRSIGDYAVAYADQLERDFEAFGRAVRTGKLESGAAGPRVGKR